MSLTERDRHEAYEALRETFGAKTDIVSHKFTVAPELLPLVLRPEEKSMSLRAHEHWSCPRRFKRPSAIAPVSRTDDAAGLGRAVLLVILTDALQTALG